jgi:hypothetical protein
MVCIICVLCAFLFLKGGKKYIYISACVFKEYMWTKHKSKGVGGGGR